MALHFLAGESRQTNWHNSAFHGLFGLFRWIPLNFTFCAGLCGFGSFLLHFLYFQHIFVCFESKHRPEALSRGCFGWDSGGCRWVPVGSGSHLKLSQICHISGGNLLPELGPGDQFSPENHPLLLVFRWECFSKLFCVGKCYLTAKSRHGFRWLGFKGLWTWPRPT